MDTHLSRDQVKHIAKLANLSLSEEEVKKFRGQLSETLDYIEILKKIKTGRVKDVFRSTDSLDILRKDEIKPPLPQKKALENAPRTYKGYFLTEAIFNET